MIVCKNCGGWVEATADFETGMLRCPMCEFAETVRFLPLFVVTGPSGTGKTEVLTHLRPLLPDFDIFETDLLWDSQGDWQIVRSNWLRIAFSIAQSGRATILCGTHLPEHLDLCDYRPLFPTIHYLALLCDEDELAARLRARPSWRGCDEEFITRQQAFSHWLRENADTAFSPSLTIIDTTVTTVQETAVQIQRWTQSRMP
jgi:hypothetical protein